MTSVLKLTFKRSNSLRISYKIVKCIFLLISWNLIKARIESSVVKKSIRREVWCCDRKKCLIFTEHFCEIFYKCLKPLNKAMGYFLERKKKEKHKIQWIRWWRDIKIVLKFVVKILLLMKIRSKKFSSSIGI